MAITNLGVMGSAQSKAAGTTLAITNTTGAVIPAGTLLVLSYASDNLASTTAPTLSVSNSGGVAWTRLFAPVGSGVTSTAGAGIWHCAWYALTTVDIATGATITTVTTTSVVANAAVIRGFSGAGGTVRGTTVTAVATGGSPSAVSTGTALVVGDLVVGTVGSEIPAASLNGDTDTLNGAWDALTAFGSTGGNAATNVAAGIQAKIVTANGTQTYNPVGSGDTVASVMSFVPAVTQSIFPTTVDTDETFGIATLDILEPAVTPGGIASTEVLGFVSIGPLVETFTDSFTSIDTNVWYTWNGVNESGTLPSPSVSNNQLFLRWDSDYPNYTALSSKEVYSLVNSKLSGRLVIPPDVSNGTTVFFFGIRTWYTSNTDFTENGAYILITNNRWIVRKYDNLEFSKNTSSTDVDCGAYDATKPFIRIRGNDGIVYFERSANGITWEIMYSYTPTHWAQVGSIYLSSGNWSAAGGSGSAVFDDLNFTPVSAQTVFPTAAIASQEAFGSPTLANQIVARTVLPTVIASAEIFGSSTLVTLVGVAPSAIQSAEALGIPTVYAVANAQPSGIGIGETFGTTVISTRVTILSTAIGNSETFGTISTSAISAIVPTGIASSETFGMTLISTLANLSPSVIASAEAFSAALLTALVNLTPVGIASAEAVGTPSIAARITTVLNGIVSTEIFGSTTISTLANMQPTGLVSSEAVGSPSTGSISAATPNGIASLESFSVPTLTSLVRMIPTGVASLEALGVPTIITKTSISLVGVPTQEGFGTSILRAVVTTLPSSIVTLEGVGNLSVTLKSSVIPIGIASSEMFGSLVLTPRAILILAAIVSSEGFGAPTLIDTSTQKLFVGWGVPL